MKAGIGENKGDKRGVEERERRKWGRVVSPLHLGPSPSKFLHKHCNIFHQTKISQNKHNMLIKHKCNAEACSLLISGETTGGSGDNRLRAPARRGRLETRRFIFLPIN